MVYKKKPKEEWIKPGPKKGKFGENVKRRMESFNALPGGPPLKDISPSPRDRDFYTKAQEILNKQLGKLYQKSIKSNLDIQQIRILTEMVKTALILDSKESDLPTDTSPEMVKAALNKLNEENNNERTEDPTPPKED